MVLFDMNEATSAPKHQKKHYIYIVNVQLNFFGANLMHIPSFFNANNDQSPVSN